MVGLDFGDLGDLIDIELLLFPSVTKLFCDRRHFGLYLVEFRGVGKLEKFVYACACIFSILKEQFAKQNKAKKKRNIYVQQTSQCRFNRRRQRRLHRSAPSESDSF